MRQEDEEVKRKCRFKVIYFSSPRPSVRLHRRRGGDETNGGGRKMRDSESPKYIFRIETEIIEQYYHPNIPRQLCAASSRLEMPILEQKKVPIVRDEPNRNADLAITGKENSTKTVALWGYP
ncbi:hypothetical protein niasHS_014384 [Heterodera schachtii]|uniref:Uncharacterized protein n=1 Tax=Heterodera schachtii TaxID=97005 RepID=A0ABD2I371_HETSC